MWHRVSTFLLSHQSNSDRTRTSQGGRGALIKTWPKTPCCCHHPPLSEVSTSISNTKIQKLHQMQFYSMWLEICQITSSNKNASRLRPVFVILVLSFSPSQHLHWPQSILIVQYLIPDLFPDDGWWADCSPSDLGALQPRPSHHLPGRQLPNWWFLSGAQPTKHGFSTQT